MASALYVGNISSANSEAKDDIIKKKSDGYYGEKTSDSTNMEYYIEENIMKRVNTSSDGMIDVGNGGRLIHYSKSKKRPEGVVSDIKGCMKDGETAMMGATGMGTNKKGHEGLVAREGGKLMVYESSNHESIKGVSGKSKELSEYLSDSRRSQYTDEAIIFAKKG